jgi:hypothetical protein
MKNDIVNDVCDKLLKIKDFFKLYYSYDEDNEFKIWLEYHDQDNQVDLFYDKLHTVVDNDFSSALSSFFENKPRKLKKLLSINKDLREFLVENIFVLEIFNKEWNNYIEQEGEYINIVLLPDNGINEELNKDDEEKVIKFEENKNKDDKKY